MIPQLERWNEMTRTLRRFAIFVVILGAFILIAYYLYLNRKRFPKKVRFGRSQRVHGIIFGRIPYTDIVAYSPTDDEGHCLVLGGSGAGKTSAILIPTLRSWDGTSLVIDISGDICSNTPCENRLVFEPANPDTVPYNVFAAVDLVPDYEKYEALERLADALMPDKVFSSDAGDYFYKGGKKILTAALFAFYSEDYDFCDICKKVYTLAPDKLFEEIRQTYNAKAASMLNSITSLKETNIASCHEQAADAVRIFATDRFLEKSVRRPGSRELYLEPKALESRNVFIVIDENHLSPYAPLLRLITEQCFAYVLMRPNFSKPNILFCLDEFSSLGYLSIQHPLNKFRKKGGRLMILAQSELQIDLAYSRLEREVMLENFRYIMVLGASNPNVQYELSDMIGMIKNADGTTKRVVEPSELKTLGDNLYLINPGGTIKLRKNYYYH